MALEGSSMSRMNNVGGANELITTLARMQDDAEVRVEKSTVSVAMDMADDMSALLSSFLQNNRTAKAKSSSAESIAAECEASIKEESPNCVIKINDFAKGGAMAAKQLLNFMHQLFPDPAQIALLLHAFILMKKKKKAEGEDELPDVPLELLESTLDMLMKGPDKKKAKAGINSAKAAKQFSVRLKKNESLLRGAYESFLTQDLDPIEIYQMSIEKFGIENRYIVMDYYRHALHCDINSYDPSCSSLEFGSVLEANFRMNILRSADQVFMNMMSDGEYIPSGSEWEFKLLNFFLSVIVQPDNTRLLTMNLVEDCMKYYPKNDKNNFVQHIYMAIKQLPFALFSEDIMDAEKIKASVENIIALIIDGYSRVTLTGKVYG
ncbi:HrpJ domain-containing protein [Citrobacter sp. U14242]|uniref:HrpJ domain-containing protein n=1 Tax=Citrobacter sp. U14242 TaxID=3390192 RepID=UPI00397DD89A